MFSSSQTFYADAVLFDMDGTLTDSISAVEAAWGKVARDIGQDPDYVIAATHGKRAVDNLAVFKPEIKPEEMDDEVTNFEETILFFADAYNMYGPGSHKSMSPLTAPLSMTALSSGINTPALTPGSSAASSCAPSRTASFFSSSFGHHSSFSSRLHSLLSMSIAADDAAQVADGDISQYEQAVSEEEHHEVFIRETKVQQKPYIAHHLEAWELEASSIDRSVRILPGVKNMIDSIPSGRYAVATSGAKTYAYGCMTRVGITPPPVTITADDKRLKAGKPAPDPFLLAAECLGYDASKCVVFEDSPSGIRAGVASGATVIALCTSHERSKIENCGAHFLVENMEHVRCELEGDKLKFTVTF